jgi:hypothetical protein
MNLKLTEQDKKHIIQYLRGLLKGIALTESDAVEVLSNDYWLDWSESCDINLSYNDETKNWDVTAYYVNELGQVETDDFIELDIYMG